MKDTLAGLVAGTVPWPDRSLVRKIYSRWVAAP